MEFVTQNGKSPNQVQCPRGKKTVGIRKATPNDAPRIAENNQAILTQTGRMGPYDSKSISQGVRYVLADPTQRCFYLLAYDQAEILGQLMLEVKYHDLLDQDVMHIHHVYTDNKHRGRGVFRQLLDEAEQFAQRQQIRRVQLTVAPDNHNAQLVYAKLGFEVNGLFLTKHLGVEESPHCLEKQGL